ncbi:MAG TPA: hypothetical protein VGI06_04135 [Acidimicrobiales bacterium]|jgi:hypothetical protein
MGADPDDPVLDSRPDLLAGLAAHGLVNSMAVVVLALKLACDRLAAHDDDDITQVLNRALDQAEFVIAVLREVATTQLSDQASQVLADIDAEAERRRVQAGGAAEA